MNCSVLLVATKRSMKMTLQCRLYRTIHYPFLDVHARLSYGQLDIHMYETREFT